MPNKLVTAVKENKNDIRKKLVITAAVGLGVIATAIVLSKMKDASTDVLIITETAGESLADAALSE